MTNEEIYDFIGELAIALYSKKVQISLGALRAIMLDKGKDYVNNRGMASAVSAAYRRWKTKDPIIYYAIAYTYTDREGNLAWDEPKQDKKKVKPTDEKKPISPDESAEETPETSEPECTVQECQDPQPELDLSVEEKPEEETPAETAAEEIPEEKPEEPPAKEEKKAAPKKKTGTKKAPAKKK